MVVPEKLDKKINEQLNDNNKIERKNSCPVINQFSEISTEDEESIKIFNKPTGLRNYIQHR